MEDKAAILRRLNSKDFDILDCLQLIRLNTAEIGVQYFLVQKLRSYKYDEIEFVIPQLIQILISYETNSVALEDFILSYCQEHVHFSLIVFWNLQSFVSELKDKPDSYSFQIVRDVINKLQDILFNPSFTIGHEFRENLHPAIALCGVMGASLGMPALTHEMLPLIKIQSKQRKASVFKLANFQKNLTKNLTLKNRGHLDDVRSTKSEDETTHNPERLVQERGRYSESIRPKSRTSSLTIQSTESELMSSDDEDHFPTSDTRENQTRSLRLSTKLQLLHDLDDAFDTASLFQRSNQGLESLKVKYGSRLMPNLSSNKTSSSIFSDHSEHKEMPNFKKTRNCDKILRVNYYRNVTNFALALQTISVRLSQVPKEARLSALRAELTIINETILPSEMDIPQLLPISSSKKKFHKLLRLSVNEACVLNSAARVPFLIFVEFLSDEADFNPENPKNARIIEDFGKPNKDRRSSNSALLDSTLTDAPHMEADLGDAEVQILSSKPKPLIRDLGDATKVDSNGSHQFRTRADQMRIAAVMLQQLESSGQSTSEQSAAIKLKIVKSMIDLQDRFDAISYEDLDELAGQEITAGARKLENDAKLAENWKAKKQRIRASSKFGHLPNWDLCSVIAKNGDDLPQEAFACQLIAMISGIWAKKRIPSWTRRMKILVTSSNTALVETITNAISIHSIKKSMTEGAGINDERAKRKIFTLKDYFENVFGHSDDMAYNRAQSNFAKSLASYSIICYVLQIKDRHNGNIMLDDEGHIIHIDFGFLLSNSPGSVGFEAAPFKLTMEYVEVMGGLQSSYFAQFKELCKECFLALREESEHVVNMVELMQKDSSLPCFNNGVNTSVLLRQRLQLGLSEDEARDFVEFSLIGKSLGSMYTRLYDQFQLITQGIYI